MAAARVGNYAAFSEREAAAIRWGEWVTRDSAAIPDAEFETLRSFYSEAEIVELTAVAGLFNYFNRFNNALGMEVTT